MKKLVKLLIFALLSPLSMSAQNFYYVPEMVFGNRSNSYIHIVNYDINNDWSFNNVSIYDTEYSNNENNLFFIRNLLAYKLDDHYKMNAGFGIKNPGAFISLSGQYHLNRSSFNLTYILGSTYQNGFTLEQSMIFNFTPSLSEKIELYFNLLVISNTDLKIINRGIQQIRLGIKQNQFKIGIASNLDQFNNASKTLINSGLFIKHKF